MVQLYVYVYSKAPLIIIIIFFIIDQAKFQYLNMFSVAVFFFSLTSSLFVYSQNSKSWNKTKNGRKKTSMSSFCTLTNWFLLLVVVFFFVLCFFHVIIVIVIINGSILLPFIRLCIQFFPCSEEEEKKNSFGHANFESNERSMSYWTLMDCMVVKKSPKIIGRKGKATKKNDDTKASNFRLWRDDKTRSKKKSKVLREKQKVRATAKKNNKTRHIVNHAEWMKWWAMGAWTVFSRSRKKMILQFRQYCTSSVKLCAIIVISFWYVMGIHVISTQKEKTVKTTL